MSKANGIGVSSGVAMGEALCVRHTAPDASHVLISDKEAELRKADAAIADAREKLKNIVPGSEDEKAMLFVAMSFLEDPESKPQASAIPPPWRSWKMSTSGNVQAISRM